MTRILPLTLLLLASGCATVTQTSGDAICDATRQARADHAVALAVSGDDAVLTGQRLIAIIDAACR